MKKNEIGLMGILGAFFLALLPFVYSGKIFYGGTNGKYFYVVGCLTILFLYFSYLILNNKKKIVLKNRWLFYITVLTLISYIASSFLAVYPGVSFFSDILRSTGVLFLIYIYIFSFILGESLNIKGWQFIRKAIAYSAGFFSFLTILGINGLGIEKFLFINLNTQGLSFANTTFAGAYLLLAFIITLIEFSRSEKGSKVRKIFGGLVLVQFFSPLLFNSGMWLGKTGLGEVFTNPALLLGEARASSATAFLILIYLAVLILIKKYVPEQPKKVLSYAWPTGFAGAIIISLILLFTPGSVIQERYIDIATGARVVVWETGFRAFKETPLFGWGPENFRFAFEHNFDNRLYLEEFLGEIWFDRAHNVVVDNLVSVGLVGSLFTVFVLAWFLRVIYRANRKENIGSLEAHLLGIFVFAHLLQLQTAFDTVSTYVLVGVFMSYGLWLEREMVLDSKNNFEIQSKIFYKFFGVFVIILALVIGSYVVFYEQSKQRALIKAFRADNKQSQLSYINKGLSSTTSFEAIRISSSSFVKGWFEQIATAPNDQKKKIINIGLEHLKTYEKHYQEYLNEVPEDYRARMNYVYLLLIHTTMGENKLEEARGIIKNSYELSPTNPITYALDAIISLYSGDIKKAEELAEKGIALNPEIEFTQEIKVYIEKQKQQFPNVTVIKLENL